MRVVPTRGIAEAFAALMGYDPEAPVAENAKEMAALASNVVAGEVTMAVRDSSCEVGPIAEGDFLGIAGDGIRAVEPRWSRRRPRCSTHLVTDDHEIVTIIEGEGSTPADTRPSPSGSTTTGPAWRPRSTTAASRSTRTSSASSSTR